MSWPFPLPLHTKFVMGGEAWEVWLVANAQRQTYHCRRLRDGLQEKLTHEWVADHISAPLPAIPHDLAAPPRRGAE